MSHPHPSPHYSHLAANFGQGPPATLISPCQHERFSCPHFLLVKDRLNYVSQISVGPINLYGAPWFELWCSIANWIMELHNWNVESSPNLLIFTDFLWHPMQLSEIKTKLYWAKISPHDFQCLAFVFKLYLSNFRLDVYSSCDLPK